MTRRTVDGSDEPWGVLALITIIIMVAADRPRLVLRQSTTVLAAAGILSLSAAIGMSFLPPIVATAIAVVSVVVLLAGMLPPERPRVALACMALLALPLTASLNFYLGYPLRLLCSHGAAAILSLVGWQTSPEGAALLWNGKTILVDAPCAGIAMLWVGFYTAALMSYRYRASALRTIINLMVATSIVVMGNILRNAVLFFKEADIISLPGWTHDAIGLALFGFAFVLMYKLLSWRPYACS
jgi:exosortase/archaeosortase family protein